MPLSEEELEAAESSLAEKRDYAQQLRDEIAEAESSKSREVKGAEVVIEHKQMDEEIARLERQKELALAESPFDAAVERVVSSGGGEGVVQSAVTTPVAAPGLYDSPTTNLSSEAVVTDDEADDDDNTDEV